MCKYFLPLVFCSFAFQLSYAQSFKAFEEAGRKAFERNDYYAALSFYQKAHHIAPNRIDIVERIASSAENFGALSIAEERYQQIANSESASRYPEVTFRLAEVKRNKGQYLEARELYEKFIRDQRNNAEMDALVVKAERGIENSNWAINVKMDSTTSYKVAQLGESINTPYSDFSPVKTGDTLYYSSLQFEKEDDDYPVDRLLARMLKSVEGQSSRSSSLNLDEKHVAHRAFTPDGNGMYYTICDYVGETLNIRCQLYYRKRRIDGGWETEIKLPDFVNLPEYTTTQPSVGVMPDGKEVLFFVSNRPGSLDGSLDIWTSTIEPGGNYAEPVNLREINTVENDVTPFYHDGEQTLYFSSQGYPNMGGYDIYKTKKSASTWQDAEHLGYPINSSYNDLYYFMNGEENKAYFSSNRLGATYLDKERETCCNDIYSAIYVDLKPLTFNAINQQPITGATVHVLETAEMMARQETKYDKHEYYFPLGFEKRYKVFATKEGWEPSQTIELTTEELNDSKTFIQPLYLTPRVDLTAWTFDEITKEPLNGVRVELIEVQSNQSDPKTDENGNKYEYDLQYGKRYKVIAFKEGYTSPQPLFKSTLGLAEPTHFRDTLYLKRIPPQMVTVYFDNDRPGENLNVPRTQADYVSSFERYKNKKDAFITSFREADRLPQDTIEKHVTKLNQFFEDEVIYGYQELVRLTEEMIPLLEAGHRVTLKIQGFASPRFKEKNDGGYNRNLACRRVMSIRNYLAKTPGIAEHLDKNLILDEECLGDTPSRGKAPDNMDDTLGSIFSVEASRWRKVRIDVVEISDLEN